MPRCLYSSDSFSLSILQAIYLGTPVVAYDIAGISLYKNFSCVKLVKEVDIRKMVEISQNILSNKNISFNDATLDDFINQHQDWFNVANAQEIMQFPFSLINTIYKIC